MIEQLDLFVESCPNYENENTALTIRQNELYNLITHNSLILHKKTTQHEIYDKLKDYGYEWKEDDKVHDHCVAIWNDIETINESGEKEKYLLYENYECWVGSERENKEILVKKWFALAPRLKRYHRLRKRLLVEGQGKLFPQQDNGIFFENSFNAYDMEMQQLAKELENAHRDTTE